MLEELLLPSLSCGCCSWWPWVCCLVRSSLLPCGAFHCLYPDKTPSAHRPSVSGASVHFDPPIDIQTLFRRSAKVEDQGGNTSGNWWYIPQLQRTCHTPKTRSWTLARARSSHEGVRALQGWTGAQGAQPSPARTREPAPPTHALAPRHVVHERRHQLVHGARRIRWVQAELAAAHRQRR